jgi:hypothetical protein
MQKKALNQEETASKIAGILKERMKDNNSVWSLASQALKGANEGLELEVPPAEWFEKRFKYQFVWLEKEDYLKALIRALWLAPVFAGTDFGGARQRDMAQVWTDTARGFLGEIALSKFFLEKFGVEVKLETRRGELKEFLSTDVSQIRFSDGVWRQPSLRISVKTTKFGGRWLDLPGAQFQHSDVFILVKIGILRQHFLAFLKAISFLKEKLFPIAEGLGELSAKDAKRLWDEIPEFDPIPGYIAGFLLKSEISLPVHMVNAEVRGKKRKRIVITHGVGLFSPRTVRELKEIRELDQNKNLPIEVEPIMDSLSGDHFLAHSGSLKYGEGSWRQLINRMLGCGEKKNGEQ